MAYTYGKVSSMYSDWLGPYMKRIELEKEEREYKAPLGERNMQVLTAVLASANMLKKIKNTIEENRLKQVDSEGKKMFEVKPSPTTPVKDFPTFGTKLQAGLRKTKEAVLGPGIQRVNPDLKEFLKKAEKSRLEDAKRLQKENKDIMALGGPVKKYEYGDFIKKVPTLPDIDREMPLDIKALGLVKKGSELTEKVQGLGGEAQSMMGSVETLASDESEPLENIMAVQSLATSKAGKEVGKLGVKGVKAGIKGAKAIAAKFAKKKLGEVGAKKGTELLAKEASKQLGKEAAKLGAKEGSKWASKAAPGVGIGLGAHSIATSDSALGKVGGVFDVAAGLTSFVPGIGTLASGILGGIGTGLSVLGGVTGKRA